MLLQVSKICAELPHTKSGKVKVEQFMKLPILSEEAFKAIDKNRFTSLCIIASQTPTLEFLGAVSWPCP